jgi:hypothetical protein
MSVIRFILPNDRPRILTVARHECGHYIAARALGFRAGKLQIVVHPDGNHQGKAEINLSQQTDSKEEIMTFLERRAQVLCAGVMAEALSTSGVVDNARANQLMKSGGGADQDYAKYREVIYLIRNIKHGRVDDTETLQAQMDNIEKQIWNDANVVVQTEQGIIEDLAERLAAKVEVYDVTAELSADQLELIPALTARFRVSGT